MKTKKLFILMTALAALFAACRKEVDDLPQDEPTPLEIPEIYYTFYNTGELRGPNVYNGFQKNQSAIEGVEELLGNFGRIMITHDGVLRILKLDSTPNAKEIRNLALSLQADSTFKSCDFAELKGGIDYFLYLGQAVCIDVHEFIGYYLYTNGKTGAPKDESLFTDAQKWILLKEFELQLARFLQKNYAKQVEAGNICLELLNEPKSVHWHELQRYLATNIAKQFPNLILGLRPDQSFSSNCLRNSEFNPVDYKDIKHVTLINFWFLERPDDVGASPHDFALQEKKFYLQRDSGVVVKFNVFGGKVIGTYSGKEYTLSIELLEEEFQLCYDWAKKNNEKILFAELGCIKYADPQGQYFLNCLKLGLEYGIGITSFGVKAVEQYFFNYYGEVMFDLNDPQWPGFKYLQMGPEEIKTAQ